MFHLAIARLAAIAGLASGITILPGFYGGVKIR